MTSPESNNNAGQTSPVSEKEQCILCQIVAGKIPSKKVYEDTYAIACLDVKPAAKGHVIVIPKEHVQILPQLDHTHFTGVSNTIHAVAKRMNDLKIAEASTVFIANGYAAGQRSKHAVVHLIPRTKKDGLLKLPANKASEKELSAIREMVVGKPPEPTEETSDDKKTDLDTIASLFK